MHTKNFGVVAFNDPFLGNIDMPDLTKFASIPKKYKDDQRYYLSYTIREGERPDQISKRIYGTEDRWYLIILANDIVNMSEQWPMVDEEFIEMLKLKYPFNDVDDIHHYLNDEGQVVDPFAIAVKTGESPYDVVKSRGLTAVTIEKHETAINDAKKKIKIIDPDLVGEIETALIKEFSDVRR